ncbi:hypothetical protein L6472_05940 [Prevotella sp. E13-17]|uniref:hypothetical protein n=1 Tax=Prevotella sp. E13-17 TaxID=2913616 RepID=UPI001EDBC5C0|nr:hypothetical protein [Prevotella sp. E13-17]UKK52118.1 hypothetical protein L6472_05940 [Prevotella sp. E13-17]
MTDKVQKIREEIEKLHKEYRRKKGAFNYRKALRTVLFLIDTLQKEPVSERFAFKAIPRLLEMIEPTDRAKAYIAKLADALEVEGYSTDAKIVMESLKIMNGEKVPMATMDEEPVSEDLEEAAKHYLYSNILYDDVYVGNPTDKDCVEMFKAGAKWQKEQLMKDATEVTVHVDAGNYPYIPQTELYDYDKDIPLAKEGDKYKVILIKEN